MSSAGVAAQEIRVPLKTGFLHDGQAMGNMKSYWASRREFEKYVRDPMPPESWDIEMRWRIGPRLVYDQDVFPFLSVTFSILTQ